MARRRVGRSWQENTKDTSKVADRKLNILLWGTPGSGKTHFMGTAPKPFIIASEDGVLTLHNKSIPYYLLRDDEKVYDTVMTIIDDARKKIGIFEDIETICIDSMWKLNQMILEEIQEELGTTSGFSVWDLLRTRMNKIHSALLALDYHYIISAGEKVKEDQVDGTMKVVFNMSGSFASQMGYEVDLNLYMKVKSKGARTEYLAYAMEENKRNAKSRVKLPREMKDITFDYIFKTITEGLDKKSDV